MLIRMRLLRPINYLRIINNPKRYNWGYPLIICLFVVTYVFLNPKNIILTGENNEWLNPIMSLLHALPIFYLMALVAVSSYKNPILDSFFDEVELYLIANENGKLRKRQLTRRRFLCYLFGYLIFINLLLYLIGIIAQIAPLDAISLKIGFFIIFIFFFCQMITITLFGLFYLIDRIYWDTILKITYK